LYHKAFGGFSFARTSWEAHSAPSGPLAGFRGWVPERKEREEKGRERREGKGYPTFANRSPPLFHGMTYSTCNDVL